MSDSRALDSKSAALFRSALKQYESKEYKKGLKSLETVLASFPNHGESHAVKGLLLNCTGKSTEGYEHVRKGVRLDLTSPVCWHVFGIMHRTDKNYSEAAKCYSMALKYDKENIQVVRDLSVLQSQLGQWGPLTDTRNMLLQAKPGLRGNWAGLAVAHHLRKDYAKAIRILQSYEETLQAFPPLHDFEHSEFLLYHAAILVESGDSNGAATFLQSVHNQIIDSVAYTELLAESFLKSGNISSAKNQYESLLDRNPDCRRYYKAMGKILGLVDKEGAIKDSDGLRNMYIEYASKHPRSDAPRRVPLDFLHGDSFKAAAKDYLYSAFDRGLPSVYVNTKTILSDDSKMRTVEGITIEYLNSMEEGSESAVQKKIWALFFLSLLYDKQRDSVKALEHIEQALKFSPSVVELMMAKARITKHAGNISLAADIMEDARMLDPKDRFVNCKATKYRLRNHQSQEAERLVSMFTRNEAAGGAIGDLSDMQCLWFMLEDGESHFRQGQYGLALKRLRTVLRIFDDWADEQFDFHVYAFRKGTMRSYVEMIRWENELRLHPEFSRAIRTLVPLYCLLHDYPSLRHSKDTAALNGVPETVKAKASKLMSDSESSKAASNGVESANKAPNGDKKDDDPFGVKLLECDPLQEAIKCVNILESSLPEKLETQLFAYDVYSRKGDQKAASKALQKASEIEVGNPELHYRLVEHKKRLGDDFDLIRPESLNKFNDEFARKGGATNSLAGMKAKVILEESAQSVEQEAFHLLEQNSNISQLLEAQNILINAHSTRVDEFKALCMAKFPLSDRFR